MRCIGRPPGVVKHKRPLWSTLHLARRIGSCRRRRRPFGGAAAPQGSSAGRRRRSRGLRLRGRHRRCLPADALHQHSRTRHGGPPDDAPHPKHSIARYSTTFVSHIKVGECEQWTTNVEVAAHLSLSLAAAQPERAPPAQHLVSACQGGGQRCAVRDVKVLISMPARQQQGMMSTW